MLYNIESFILFMWAWTFTMINSKHGCNLVGKYGALKKPLN